jgi:TonB family protein
MRKVATGLMALSLGLGSATVAADQPPLTRQDVMPTVRTTGAVRFYPEIAQRAGVQGRASVLCSIAPNGDFTNCSALDEDPKGCQFGDAIVRLASAMHVSQHLKDGTPTAGRQYQFELSFKLPGGTPVRGTSC